MSHEDGLLVRVFFLRKRQQLSFDILIAVAVFALQLLSAELSIAKTLLDADYFPRLTRGDSNAPEMVVVQGNWPEDAVKINGAATGWLPVRLFGTTDASQLTLSFTSTAQVGTPQLPVTLRTRDVPAVAITDGSEADKIVKRPAIVKDGKWLWEGFLLIETANTDPVLIKVRLDTGGTLEGSLDLVLGECWLIAGSAGVGKPMPPAAEKEESITVTSPNGNHCVVLTEKAGSALAIPQKSVQLTPPLGTSFARALGSAFEASAFGSRPTCVYTWPNARKLIGEWQSAGRLGSAWDGLLTGERKDKPFPGVRGVVWLHGEWEAELGDFSAKNGADKQRGFESNVSDFGERYAEAGIALHNAVVSRLAQATVADASDKEIAKRIVWVVLQSAGAGRKTEFHDVFVDTSSKSVEGVSPESAWAALRAAQFSVIDTLRRETTWMGRPMAVLVPLQGVGNGEPGWIWQTSDVEGRKRFSDAGRRIADAVFRALTELGGNDPNLFKDGWPRFDSQSTPPRLIFPGVVSLEPPPQVHLPGVQRPQLLAHASGGWSEVPIPSDRGTVDLPLGTDEVRYAWADTIGIPHMCVFASPSGSALPMPAFQLNEP